MQHRVNQCHWFIDLHAMRGGNILIHERDHVRRLRRRQIQRIRSVGVHGVRARFLCRFARRLLVHGMLGGDGATKERVFLLHVVRGGSLSVLDGPGELRGVRCGEGERHCRQHVLQWLRSWPLPELDGRHVLQHLSPGAVLPVHRANGLRSLRRGDGGAGCGSGELREVRGTHVYEWNGSAKLQRLQREVLFQRVERLQGVPERVRLFSCDFGLH